MSGDELTYKYGGCTGKNPRTNPHGYTRLLFAGAIGPEARIPAIGAAVRTSGPVIPPIVATVPVSIIQVFVPVPGSVFIPVVPPRRRIFGSALVPVPILVPPSIRRRAVAIGVRLPWRIGALGAVTGIPSTAAVRRCLGLTALNHDRCRIGCPRRRVLGLG